MNCSAKVAVFVVSRMAHQVLDTLCLCRISFGQLLQGGPVVSSPTAMPQQQHHQQQQPPQQLHEQNAQRPRFTQMHGQPQAGASTLQRLLIC